MTVCHPNHFESKSGSTTKYAGRTGIHQESRAQVSACSRAGWSLVHRWARAAALAGAHGFEGHTPVCLLLEGLGISTNFKKGNLTISVENLFELLYDLVILLLVNGDVSPYESPKLYVLVESFEISRFVHLWHIKGAIAYSLIKWSGVDLGVVGSETYGIWTPS